MTHPEVGRVGQKEYNGFVKMSWLWGSCPALIPANWLSTPGVMRHWVEWHWRFVELITVTGILIVGILFKVCA